MPTPPSPASLSQLCDASCPFLGIGAGSCRAPSSRAACAPLSPRDITSLLGLCDAHTPRHSPRSCRLSMPTSPLPPAPLLRVDFSCPFARSAPAPAACRASAPRARPCHPVTSPRCSASAMLTHRAAARGRVGLPCRNCRCRPRRLRSSVTLAISPARCPLTPRAERTPLSRLLATTVTSPRALCGTHHRATAQEPVDLPRRRRCCCSRFRGASTLLALLRARRRPLPRAE